MEVLERGIERYGPESVPPLLLAWCLLMAGRPAEALERAEQAVEEEPRNADAHWMRANALLELERTDEASRVLWGAVELMPDNGRYYMQLAWVVYEHEEYAKVRKLVEQALERSPEDAWVHCTAARIYDHHLRHRLAHAHYARAFELDPDEPGVRGDLAEILQTRGRLSSGVRVAWEAADDEREADGEAALYDATLRRWSWRWYEWVLRAALMLNVIDWVAPTPVPGSAVLAGVLVAGYAIVWTRSLLALPRQCRRDLAGRGRRGFLAGALARTALVLGVIVLVLLGEPTGWQHLGVLALIAGGYAEWYFGAVRISRAAGARAWGREPAVARA
ncbi:tetratricopeptide repeat protein [Glycomyces sp. A-F 0318]|uniref:tetratricopeptide repeat protein n=1 Tax=Glycomyces amatae TaxID=2881355 RepID=UPI001E38530B|nr:tetratricopeptide repeat protein [Glycomyces amatae]